MDQDLACDPGFDRQFALGDGSMIRQRDLGRYLLDFRAGAGTLVITFENRDDRRSDPERPAWGFNFLKRFGFALLGVKAKRPDWYRGAELHAYFRSAAFSALCRPFRRVILYGSSMGGYAALTFATPGSEVIAHNPQTSLDKRLVPWETRYLDGQAQDWSGDFADAAEGARRAKAVFVTYDPFFDLDRRQAARLHPGNLRLLKAPMLGHSLPSWLSAMDVLKPAFEDILEGRLTPERWGKLIRRRRGLPRYYLRFAALTDNPRVAARCLEEAAAVQPLQDSELKAVLRLTAKRGAWREAEAAIRRFVAANGPSAFCHRRLADALLRQERAAEALAEIEQAIALEPMNAEAHCTKGRILLAGRQWAEASEAARQALLCDPANIAAHGLSWRALRGLGELPAATAVAARLAALTPDARSHLIWADLLMRQSRWSEAASALRTALELAPDEAAAQTRLAACLARQKARGEAPLPALG